MKITVEVTGWLKKFTQGTPRVELDVEQGSKASDVFKVLSIPEAEIGFISVKSANTDGDNLVDNNFVINDGDILRLYSPIVGG